MSDFFGGGGPVNLSFAQHNPLFGRGAGRNIIELSFDDSIDATHSLECYFVMPDRTRAVTAANVWVQTKPFRQYVASISSETTHTHTMTADIAGSSSVVPTSATTAGSSAHTTDAQGLHTHLDGDGVTTTGASVTHSHNVNTHTHGIGLGSGVDHTHNYSAVGAALSGTVTTTSGSSHTHVLTTGIFETAASGTIALFVADDGVTYDATHPIATGVAVATGVTKQDILATPSGGSATSHLTKATGNKRIKITGTALMRVQVLIVLDLKVSVF